MVKWQTKSLQISESVLLAKGLSETLIADRPRSVMNTEILSGEFEQAELLSNEVQRRY